MKSGVTLGICYFSGFHLFDKIFSDRLRKCFTRSLISPKHFSTTVKLISSYPGLSFVFNEKEASFNLFFDNDFFPLNCVFNLRK